MDLFDTIGFWLGLFVGVLLLAFLHDWHDGTPPDGTFVRVDEPGADDFTPPEEHIRKWQKQRFEPA